MAKKKVAKKKYEITGHINVPKHSKLNPKECKILFEKYDIRTKNLPKINLKDPILSGLDVVEGDVVKIERESPTSGDTVYYRGVING